MCDTARCPACRGHVHGSKESVFWPMVVSTVWAAAVALWWLTRKVIGPTLIVVAYCTWVWLSGGTWRQQIPRRIVRRQVRAVGNWLISIAVVMLILQPLATAIVLGIAGGGLIAMSVTSRQRELTRRHVAILAARREPAELQITAGRPIRGEITAQPISAEVVLPDLPRHLVRVPRSTS